MRAILFIKRGLLTASLVVGAAQVHAADWVECKLSAKITQATGATTYHPETGDYFRLLQVEVLQSVMMDGALLPCPEVGETHDIELHSNSRDRLSKLKKGRAYKVLFMGSETDTAYFLLPYRGT